MTFLRSFPDFVAMRAEPNELGVREIFPVEVKFRTERVFQGDGRPLRTIRLSMDHVHRYMTFWPSTLVVVVCYRARTMTATRADRLRQTPDGRVPIHASVDRRSWFYDVEGSQFRPIWSFVQGYFDRDLCEAAVTDVIAWADAVKEQHGLHVD